MIRPVQLLALSLIALGASTLHGMRSPAPLTPGLRLPAAASAASLPRERMLRYCAPSRERAAAAGCGAMR